VAAFCFAKEGHLGKLATKNTAIEVNHPYLPNLTTRLLARPGRVLL
jgi:hypothetical protein